MVGHLSPRMMCVAGCWIAAHSKNIYHTYRALSNQTISEDKQDSNRVAMRNLLIEAVSVLDVGSGCTLNEIRTNSKYRRTLGKITPEKLLVEVASLTKLRGHQKRGWRNTWKRGYFLLSKLAKSRCVR